jgi:glycosyltransferase involved in cell wall biosynthesis
MVSPLKPFEAMAMGKVVLASNVAALAEIVQDGYNGVLFEKDNVKDLASKLEMLINNPTLRKQIGKQAREWVERERDWKHLSKKVSNIYRKLLNRKNNGA